MVRQPGGDPVAGRVADRRLRRLGDIVMIKRVLFFALALASGLTAATAQDRTPATHRGTGTEIANNYRFLNEDRERVRSGAFLDAVEQGRQNVGAFASLRARQGRPATR